MNTAENLRPPGQKPPAPPAPPGLAPKQSLVNDNPTADQIFKAAAATKRQPFIVEGAGRVWVHRLGHHEATLLFDSLERDDKGDISDPYDDAKLIQRCVYDKDDKRKFSEADIPRIQAMGNDIFLGLSLACMTINGIGEAGREAIAKNLGTITQNDSESD